MLRKTTRREKRAAARLTKMMRRSLGKEIFITAEGVV